MKPGKRKLLVLRYSEKPFRVQVLPPSFLLSAWKPCVHVSQPHTLKMVANIQGKKGKG